MTPLDDRYISLKELSLYSGYSIRALRSKLQGIHPIPHFKPGNKILVLQKEFDVWMETYRVKRPITKEDKERIKQSIEDSTNELKTI